MEKKGENFRNVYQLGFKEASDTSKVTRVEVIDHTKSYEQGGGRAYSFWQEGVEVAVDLQDEGRTLKVFISPK